jgi:glycosyltransferase involved in cell wall biosynthesis
MEPPVENIVIEISANSPTPTICLNMIVKNESKIIVRLIQSVLSIIDSYCICDTGSTDNTIEIIENFFRKYPQIQGTIIKEPFRDFGYNRTFAANAASNVPKMDYLLLMDADMILTGNALQPQNIFSFKTSLKADCYHICQGTPGYYYKNVRLMKNYRGYSYWGVTHEYVSTPPGTVYEAIPIETLFISDIGDGGAKIDKFERDIRLLTKGLEENPNSDRYTFYLANSYRDAGQIEKAIETFRKRIAIGGWIEEVWHSHYSIGNCYESLGQMEKAISSWIDAFEAHPKRIESLYKIVNYYRERGKNHAAYLFANTAYDSLRRYGASDDYLFLQKDVYDYKLDYEMTILGYYANYRNESIPLLSMKVLSYPHLPDATSANVLNNYKFYSPKITALSTQSQKALLTATDSLGIADSGEFVKSTPSLTLRGNHLIVNVRYVNYRIDDKGNYVNQANVITRNAIAVLDISMPIWKIVQEFELLYDKSQDGYYIGLEDIRLFYSSHANNILYNANRGMPDGRMTVEHGMVILDSEQVKLSSWPKWHEKHNNSLEKNWVLFPGVSDAPCFIYHWSPEIYIGKMENGQISTIGTSPSPYFFKYLRGSTNGIVINNEIWLICHAVSYEDRRYYYHIIVVIDRETYQLKRWTPFFTFEGAHVEYTLGFVYLEQTDELLIGYSLYDKSAKYIQIPRNYFENQMI